MRATSLLRLLLVPLGLAASACDESESPLSPTAEEATLPEAPAALAGARWADGYVTILDPLNLSITPRSMVYNRSGTKVTVTRAAVGRYIATFPGLSALLGTKSTVQVTGYSLDNGHCKSVNGSLVNDKVEVRCFNSATGAPAEAAFSVLVLRKAADRAFAYAHQPTTASYAPQAKATWNPSGATKVTRLSTGSYHVVFNNLGTQLASHAGIVHVNAVGIGSAYCKLVEEWGGSPNLGILVQCYTLAGMPVDAKFTVLLQRKAEHVGYAYANQPTTASYTAEPFWSSNPAGGSVTIQRASPGVYYVDFPGADTRIIDYGNMQVTAVGFYDYAQCKIHGFAAERAAVRCFAPNGTLVDAAFTLLLGS